MLYQYSRFLTSSIIFFIKDMSNLDATSYMSNMLGKVSFQVLKIISNISIIWSDPLMWCSLFLFMFAHPCELSHPINENEFRTLKLSFIFPACFKGEVFWYFCDRKRFTSLNSKENLSIIYTSQAHQWKKSYV